MIDIEELKVKMFDYFENEFMTGALTIVLNRIQQKGENAEGGKFTPYSTKPVPPFFYEAIAVRKGVTSKLKEYKEENKNLSYADFRRLAGRQTDNKDFTMTGDMWNSFNVIAVQDGFSINAEFGFLDPAQKQKYDWNNEREPSEIVDFSEQEMSDFGDELITKLTELI
jgi:hypothetical protein